MSPESNIPDKPKTPPPSGKSLSAELKKSTAADFKKNRLGKYEIKKKIGAGGMGAVYLAVDTELGRTVALKILPREKAQNPTLVKRFKAEGQAAALLRHENIVTVYEAGEADGFLYLALEYIEGTDVHNLVAKRGVLPVKRTIEIIRQLTRALQHAYEQNIVHRDIKPSNFLIKRDGTVKLTDMGLARSIDETSETGITRAGTTVGTVDYMSPEQARDSKAADVRSDIYSLGCSWYQMLTGDAPFNEGSLTNKLAAHATKPPPDPRDKNESVPEGVVAVIRKMMAKNPTERYQTPEELLVDLDNRTLTRGSVSNNVLEALAGADGEAAPAKRSSTLPRSMDLPPKMDAVPLLGESKPIDISKIKIAGGVALVVLVVGLFGWAAQKFAADDGNLPGGNHSFLRQEGDDGTDGGSPTGGKGPSGRSGEVNGGGANSNLPNAPPPNSGVAPPPTGGVSSQALVPGASGNSNSSALAPQAVGVIATREGEVQHLPEWSQSSEMLVHSGSPIIGELPGNSAGGPPQLDRPRSSSGVTGPRAPGVASGSITTGQTTPVAQPAPRGERGGNVPAAGGRPSNAPTNTPDPAAPRTYPSRPPADIKIVAGVPPQYVTADAAPQASGQPGQPRQPGRAVSNGATVRGAPPPKQGSTGTQSDSGSGRRASENSESLVAGSVSALHAALLNLPPEGGTIELTGSGPFFLPSIDLQGRARIVIRAAENFTPILVFVPEAEAEANASSLLRVSDGTLSLIGINFVVVAEHFPPNDPLTMVEIDAGDLTVHDCSFTLVGTRTGRTSAIRLTGAGQWKDRTPADQARALVNRAWIRGRGLTGLTVDRLAADVVVNNSLLTTGSAPVFAFDESPPSGVTTTPAVRICRVLSSTLAANSIWKFSNREAGFPSTLIATVNSLIANSDRLAPRPMLFAQGPAAASASGETTSAANWLDWQTEGTVFCGWSELVRVENASGMPVVNVANQQDWRRIWKQALPVHPFRADAWPTQPIDDLSGITPFAFYAGTLSTSTLSVTPSGLPGCFVEQLLVPSPHQFERAIAWANKPRLPTDFFDTGAGEPLTVDINDEDLGLWLAKQDLSPGATIIAEGTGFCKSSPLEIANATVSIRFRSTGEAPPILIPQLTRAAPEGLSVLNPTFILVSQGKLELRDAIILIEPDTRRKNSIPDWLLRVEQGSFSLQHCFLRGPTGPSPDWKGLIYWSGLPKAPGQESPQSAGAIVDSFLYGPEKLIDADLSGQLLTARNAVFSSSGRIADLRLPADASSNVVDLQRCTLSAAFACLAVSHPGQSRAPEARLTFFSEETAFAPSKDFRPGDATQQIVLTTNPEFSREQLDWWEFSNAYAESIEHFRGPIDQPLGEPQDIEADWVGYWGPSHVQKALHGKNAVALRGQSRSQDQQEWGIDDFNLDKQSQAAKWSETGTSIGAQITAPPGPPPAQRTSRDNPSRPNSESGKAKPKFNP